MRGPKAPDPSGSTCYLQRVTEQDIDGLVRRLAERAKAAARVLATASTARKNAVLLRAAAELRGDAGKRVLAANAKDLEAAKSMDLSPAMRDRLRLDDKRLEGVAEGIEAVAALPDPVGQTTDQRRLPNGVEVSRMRIPLGLIGIIYESRPNVTADAAALCVKAGNAVILRGGKEAFHSNRALAEVFATALESEGLDPATVSLIPTTDRQATTALIGLSGIVDVIIPRGGEGLIRFVSEHARVPVIQHYKGLCHVYVDGAADLEMALRIAVNAKTHRPGVCNAMETLLVDEKVADAFLAMAGPAFGEAGVELRADPRAKTRLPGAAEATAEDFDTEHLALVLNVAVVDGLEGALAHVAEHGSNHTEAIVTNDDAVAKRWVQEVDASLVLVNASTRFNDGFQLGLGAEMGISTSKLHAYGPMGLAELCTLKWVAFGEGQIRT